MVIQGVQWKNNKYVVIVSKSGVLFDEFISRNYFYKLRLSSRLIKYLKYNEFELSIFQIVNYKANLLIIVMVITQNYI